MRAIRAVLGIGMALLLSGCLAATGTAAAALLLGSDDGGSDGEPIPPAPQLDAPVIPLPGTPVAMVVGDFFEGAPLDVAVLIGDRGILSIFKGDGLGGFPVRVDLELDVSFPKDVAKVPRPDGLRDALLVADRIGLQVMDWDEGLSRFRVVQTVEFVARPGDSLSQQQIAVGNFDGQDPLDVAVSLQSSNRVEVFFGRESEGAFRLRPEANLVPASSPAALAAANFDADGSGLSDLVLIEEPSSNQGDPFLRLLLNQGDGKFEKQSILPVPDLETGPGVTLHAREGALFEDEDDFPDLIACKVQGAFRVLVRKDAQGKPFLDEHPAPTGPPAIAPRDAALIRLPREVPGKDLWDIVAVDGDPNGYALSIEYTEDNLEGSPSVRLSLPGEGVAVRACQLDGEGLEDLLVATSAPSPGLVVLLSNPEAAKVQKEPLRIRQAALAGENLPAWVSINDVTSGRYRSADDTLLPFVAVSRQGKEVVIVFLDAGGAPTEPELLEFHSLQSPEGLLEVDSVRAADLDGDEDDDLIVVSGSTLRLLRNDGFQTNSEQDAFQWIDGAGLLVDLGTYDDIRNPTVARIDPGEDPDIVMPADKSNLIIVVLNPKEGAENKDWRFVPTLENPRQVSVTEIDGDGFPDLLVSNKNSHMIDVLLGDPRSRGDFVFAPPVNLESISGKVELTVTDLSDPGATERPREPARFIVFATEEKVALMLNRTEQPGLPVLVVPPGQDREPIYSGVDAEFLILADISRDGLLDLIVADEEAGVVKLFMGKADPSDPFAGPLRSFDSGEDLPLFEGRPDELALFLFGSGLGLAATTKRSTLELYHLSCPSQQSCAFDRKSPIDLAIQDQPGGPAGFSAAPGNSALIASLVEDRESITGESAIDRIRMSTPLDALSIRDIGLPGRVERVPLDTEISADGVLVGHFGGDGQELDVLVHDRESGDLFILPDGGGPRIECGVLDEPIRDMVCVPDGSGSRHEAFVVTDHSTWILDPKAAAPLERVASFEEEILGAAPVRDRSGAYMAATLLDGSLVARGGGSKDVLILDRAPAGIVGCARLDGDQQDDIVLVTRHWIHTFQGVSPARLQDLEFTSSGEPRDIAFLDANGDTHVDLCIATSKDTVIVLPGNRKGHFVAEAMREVFVWPGIEAIAALPLEGAMDAILVSARSPGFFVVRTLDPGISVR